MRGNEAYSVKNEIMHAVMDLMSEKNYMDITVSDIINKAGVARASFYRNFDTISDVLDLIVENVSNEMVDDVFPILTGNDERKWREFLFEHFYRMIRMKKDMKEIKFENLSVIITRLNDSIIIKEQDSPLEGIHDKYIISAKSGLINSVSKRWLDTGMKETPEEMIDYIMSFITCF